MSEFKGTKGKWELHTFVDGRMSVRNEDNTRKICVSRVNDYDQSLANLLLISKAPEMLEMLKYFVDNNMLSVVGEEMAKQLIKQATEL